MNEEVSPAMFVYSIGMCEGQSVIKLLPFFFFFFFFFYEWACTYVRIWLLTYMKQHIYFPIGSKLKEILFIVVFQWLWM